MKKELLFLSLLLTIFVACNDSMDNQIIVPLADTVSADSVVAEMDTVVMASDTMPTDTVKSK